MSNPPDKELLDYLKKKGWNRMTKRKTIIECPKCGKEICLTLDTLGNITYISQEKEWENESENDVFGVNRD